MRYVPMEMYVNLKMVAPRGGKSKAPWIALGVYALVFMLVLTAVGLNAARIWRDESWGDGGAYDDYLDEPDFWEEYGDSLPDDYTDEYDGGEYGGYEEEEPTGIDAIPEDIAGNLPYEIEDELYTFSDEEKQSMVIEFHVN